MQVEKCASTTAAKTLFLISKVRESYAVSIRRRKISKSLNEKKILYKRRAAKPRRPAPTIGAAVATAKPLDVDDAWLLLEPVAVAF